MTDFEQRQFYASYIAALNAHEFDRMTEFVHDDVSQQGEPSTREHVEEDLRAIVDAVPDFHWIVQDIAVDADRLGVRLIDTGSPVQEWLGVHPTGKRFEITEYATYTIRDGKFQHMSATFDAATLRAQLEAD